MSNLLITRPNHDVTTNYLYYWSQKILDVANEKGIRTVDLKGKRANKKEFTSVINKIKPHLVILNGHGDDRTITGFDNKILLEVGSNEKLLEGKIAYAVSCSSAKMLGPKCINSGTHAYIGYTDDFAFIIDESKITKPLEDKTACLFLEPSNQVAISLIKGNNTSSSYKRSQEFFKRNISHLLTSESPKEEKEALPYLLWDMRNQVCLGDQKASL